MKNTIPTQLYNIHDGTDTHVFMLTEEPDLDYNMANTDHDALNAAFDALIDHLQRVLSQRNLEPTVAEREG